MKHEALTEAISMLDDDLIAEAQEPFRKRSALPAAIKICAVAAACAAAVFAFLLIPRGGAADILIMGENPSEKPVAVRLDDAETDVIRAFSFEPSEIPVKVASSAKTIISISAGELYISGEGAEKVPAESPLELSGNAELLWSVPLWDSSAEYEFTAQTGEIRRVFLLFYDENAQEWTVKDKSAD